MKEKIRAIKYPLIFLIGICSGRFIENTFLAIFLIIFSAVVLFIIFDTDIVEFLKDKVKEK